MELMYDLVNGKRFHVHHSHFRLPSLQYELEIIRLCFEL